MNKFKVGDFIMLKDDIKVGKNYGGLDFIHPMNCLIGEKIEIKSIPIGEYYVIYHNDKIWFLNDEMIQEIPVPKWKTHLGELINISEMTDVHIQNVIMLISRSKYSHLFREVGKHTVDYDAYKHFLAPMTMELEKRKSLEKRVL